MLSHKSNEPPPQSCVLIGKHFLWVMPRKPHSSQNVIHVVLSTLHMPNYNESVDVEQNVITKINPPNCKGHGVYQISKTLKLLYYGSIIRCFIALKCQAPNTYQKVRC